MTALVAATQAGDRDRAEILYLAMMDLSAKMHFTESTIASQLGLYARGFDGGFARRPMRIPLEDKATLTRIRGWLEEAFADLELDLEVGAG